MFKTIVEVIINRQRVKENMCGGLEGGQIEIFRNRNYKFEVKNQRVINVEYMRLS